MIEIIKRGTKKTCNCNKCGCYFKYEDDDILSMVKPNVIGVGFIKTINCPQCGTKIILEQTK